MFHIPKTAIIVIKQIKMENDLMMPKRKYIVVLATRDDTVYLYAAKEN